MSAFSEFIGKFFALYGQAAYAEALAAEAGAFNAVVLRGEALAAALDAAGEHFAFDRWLLQALQQRWLVAVQPLPSPSSP